jgi:DNA-binding transcriptional LysR family regulator
MDLPVVRWVCVVCANHPSVTDELTRDQFLSLPHLYVSTPDDLRDLGDAVRRDYGADVKVQVTTQNALEAPFMLRGTSLIAVLPERLVNTLRSSVSLRVFAVPAELVPAQRLSLLWHRRNEPDPGHAWLREQIRSVMRAGHMTH